MIIPTPHQRLKSLGVQIASARLKLDLLKQTAAAKLSEAQARLKPTPHPPAVQKPAQLYTGLIVTGQSLVKDLDS